VFLILLASLCFVSFSAVTVKHFFLIMHWCFKYNFRLVCALTLYACECKWINSLSTEAWNLYTRCREIQFVRHRKHCISIKNKNTGNARVT
jgi:hypothetical protein